MKRFPLVAAAALVAGLLVSVGGSSTAAVAASAVPGAPVAPAVPAAPQVYPIPDRMTLVGSPVRLAGRIRVVTTAKTDAAALTALVRLLKRESGGSVDVTGPGSDGAVAASLTVVMGDTGDAPVAARLAAAHVTVPEKAEAYALAVLGTSSQPSIVIGGADGAGQFYGVQTLRQLVQRRNEISSVPGVLITDQPAMPLRGTIEGFYGTPWTQADRLRQVEFLGSHKMNEYIYAPKDDPYHRERWRDPYPADKLAELTDLVTAARNQHVAFRFAISPGVSVCYSGEADFNALVAKSEQMWGAGVRSFAVLLDDIDPALRCDADRARFGGDESPAAAAQAYLLNRYRTEFLAPRSGADKLMTVPTEYGQPSGATAYTRRFAALVDPAILVMWTGTSPFGATTGADVQAAHDVFGHDVLLWDNYPVNDFAVNRLFLGPLRGRGADLAEAGMVGYVSNPMNQSAASELPLFTAADYTWNPRAYDADKSWDAGLHEIGGAGYAALRTFAENSQSWYLHPEESPDLVAAFDAFWRAYESGGSLDTAAGLLQQRLDRLAQLPAELRLSVHDDALLEDIGAHADKLALLAHAASAAASMLVAQGTGNGDAAWRGRARTNTARAAALAAPQEIASAWTGIGRPGRNLVDEFVARALQANERWLGLPASDTHPEPAHEWTFDRDGDTEGWVAGHSVSPLTTQGGALTTQVTGGDPYVVFAEPLSVAPSCEGSLIAEVTVGVTTGGGAQIYFGTEEGPGYSEARQVRFDIAAGAPATYLVPLPTAGSALTDLRLDLPDNAGQVTISSIRVLVNRSQSAGTVTGGPAAKPGSSLDFAVDRCLTSTYAGALKPEAGDALTVVLPKPASLAGLVVLQEFAAPITADVQVRNGGVWRSIGSVDSAYGDVAASGDVVDAVRLLWAPGSQPPSITEIIPFYGGAEPVTASMTGPSGGTVEIGSTFPVEVRLASTGLTAVEGTLDLTVPNGWTAAPTSAHLTIPRGGDVRSAFQVTVPADAVAGDHEVSATFTAADGRKVSSTLQVQVVPSAGTQNLALAGTSTASSVELGLPQFVAARATDGDQATRWSSASTDGEWLQVELAAPVRLAKVVLSWETAYGAAYKVQVSDGTDVWRDVASVTGGDGGRDEVRFDTVTPVRLLRIQGVDRGTEYGYSLRELEIYGVA